jgi:hypothetical protein
MNSLGAGLMPWQRENLQRARAGRGTVSSSFRLTAGSFEAKRGVPIGAIV